MSILESAHHLGTGQYAIYVVLPFAGICIRRLQGINCVPSIRNMFVSSGHASASFHVVDGTAHAASRTARHS